MDDIPRILAAIEQGDPQAGAQLLPLVYDELRGLAARLLAQEPPGQTLDATALVHEAYLRLAGPEDERRWNSRRHFFAAAAEAMRRLLVDRARRKRSQKHGGDLVRHDLEESELAAPALSGDLLAVDEALTRLAATDPSGGRADQAPVFRRPLHPRGRRRPGRIAAHRRPDLGLRPRLAP
jgi:RNA polymerase sigma factor (TIGR02999 family)